MSALIVAAHGLVQGVRSALLAMRQALQRQPAAQGRPDDLNRMHFRVAVGPQSAAAHPTSVDVQVTHADAAGRFTSLGANPSQGETAVAYATLRIVQHASNSEVRLLVQRLQAATDAALASATELSWRPRRVQWSGPLLVGAATHEARHTAQSVPVDRIDSAAYLAAGFRVVMCKVFFNLEQPASAEAAASTERSTSHKHLDALWQRMLPEFNLHISSNLSMPELLALPGHDMYTAAEVAALRKHIPLFSGASTQQHLQCLASNGVGGLVPPAQASPRRPVPPLCAALQVQASTARSLVQAASRGLQSTLASVSAGSAVQSVLGAVQSGLGFLGVSRSFEFESSFESLPDLLEWLAIDGTAGWKAQASNALGSPIFRRRIVRCLLSAVLPELQSTPSSGQGGRAPSAEQWGTTTAAQLALLGSTVDTCGIQSAHTGLHCTLGGLHLPSLLQPYLARGVLPAEGGVARHLDVLLVGGNSVEAACVLRKLGAQAAAPSEGGAAMSGGAAHGGTARPDTCSNDLHCTAEHRQLQLRWLHQQGKDLDCATTDCLLFCVPSAAPSAQYSSLGVALARDLKRVADPCLPLLIVLCGVERGGDIPDLQSAAAQLGVAGQLERPCGLVYVASDSGRGMVSGLRWLIDACEAKRNA